MGQSVRIYTNEVYCGKWAREYLLSFVQASFSVPSVGDEEFGRGKILPRFKMVIVIAGGEVIVTSHSSLLGGGEQRPQLCCCIIHFESQVPKQPLPQAV